MKDFRESVVYQIYPKSFNDSNGDGIGDINGVTEKLDYLKELGVDYIWLTPVYVSPQKDNGYDVADYYKIDPRMGTMEDFDNLVEEAKKRNIDIMLDMVFNHTSTEHEWFKKALKGDKKYKDFYIFKEGKNNEPPTNWVSKFGGNAWEYVEEFNEYYLHLFDVTQGDLNWDNEEVRSEIYKVVNFWLDKGVKGFRLDVINLISKPEVFESDNIGDGRRFYTDGPNIHKYLKELNKNTFGKYEDIITVGEMSSTSVDNCIKYSNPEEKELSMVFNFHHLKVDYKNGDKWTMMDFDFKMLKDIFKQWQEEMQEGNGWSAVFWCNHDQPRAIDKFVLDKKEHNYYSQTMLAGMFFNLRGTPFIYQGEEIGMENFERKDISEFDDIGSHGQYQRALEEGFTKEEAMHFLNLRSRDNTRTPMQWDSSEYAGFSNHKPWLKMTGSQDKINVESQFNDPNSIYSFYKKMISIRKQEDTLVYGDFEEVNTVDDVIGYKRTYQGQEILCFCNFTNKEQQIPKTQGNILLDNYNNYNPTTLKPYQFIMIKK